jgi:methyl-accepting chemotaxis protein
MRLRSRLTLVFSLVQILTAAAIGLSLSFVVRNIIEGMVEKESREMVSSISGTLDLLGSSIEETGIHNSDFQTAREFVLDRKIGETGFYFVLDENGTYIIHPNDTVEGVSWVGKHAFIDDIMSHRNSPADERFVRFVSPKTGEWKQVYFSTVPSLGWTVCSSAWEFEMYRPVSRINMVLLFVLSIAALLTILISLRVSYRLSKAFSGVAGALMTAAEGDFTVKVPVDNFARETEQATQCLNRSVSETMNVMVGTVKQLALRSSDIGARLKDDIDQSVAGITEVDGTLRSLSGNMSNLDASTRDAEDSIEILRKATNELQSEAANQATAADQSSAAIEEISATMASVRNVAEKQSEIGNELIKQLNSNKVAIDDLMKALRSIQARVEDITSFNAIINDVADRTHLLAMNAAIEAARAGESGRGFAVVSGEIRSLAESTGNNAVQVGDALELISTSIRETAAAGKKLLDYFQDLQERTRSFVDAFGQITSGTEELNVGAREIAQSAAEIQSGSRHFSETVETVGQSADHVGTLMETARALVQTGTKAFEEISVRTRMIVDAQGEISLLTGWNDRYTGYLAERTKKYISDIHVEQYRLTDALKTHQAWIRRLQEMIGVENTQEWNKLRGEMVDDSQCEFGKWLLEMGKDTEIASFPCYSEIINIHHDMHIELKRIADTIISDNRALNQSDMDRLREFSHQLVSQLDKMDTRMFERERRAEESLGESCQIE